MAVNTTTFESTLQTKLNNTSLEAKEMLLLGKALESTVGSIAVSDINTAGATKISEINAVSSNTFKTVGGTSILGSGDIATLPSQSGASGKVLKSDGTNATWGTDEGNKVLALSSNSYGTRTTLPITSNRTVFWNALNFVKVKADSKLHITLQIPLGGAPQSYPHFAEGFIRLSTSSYGSNGTDIHGPILNTRATSNDMGAGYLANFVYDSTGTNISGTGNVYISIGYHTANSSSTLHPSAVWNPNVNEQDRSWQSVSYITVTEVDA